MKRFLCLIIMIFCAATYGAHADNFKWIKEIRYEQIRPYSDGMSAFMQNKKWGYIDTEGNVVIEPVYDECRDFKNGVTIAKLKGKWGVIDKKGNCSSGFIFDAVNDFSDGLAYASAGKKLYFVKESGSMQVLSDDYIYGNFTEGMAPLMSKKKNKWGFINSNGIIVIEPKYDTVYNFSNNTALVKKSGKYYYINRKGGRKNVDLSIMQPLKYVNGYAKINVASGVGFIDKEFKVLPIYGKEATDFNKEGTAVMLMEDKSVIYINGYGKPVLKTDWDRVGNFYNGLAWVSKNGKYGYINTRGELAIDTLFTSASDFSEGIAFVSANGRFGSIKKLNPGEVIPQLQINGINIHDANNNGKVEAEEKFSINVALSNPTSERLQDVTFQFASQQDVSDWFQFDNQMVQIPELRANADTVITFTGTANLSLISSDIKMKFRGLASNTFDPVESDFEFEALGINACRPVITRYWVYKDNHTQIGLGDEVNLMIAIKNDGKDMAKNVQVDLQWPVGISSPQGSLSVPLIRPGETKELTAHFVVDSLYADGLTVVAKLSEYTRQHRDVKYLSFYTGRMNAEVNLEGGGPMMYQYEPQYFAQNVAVPTTPQVVTVDEVTQDVGKEKALDSELLDGISRVNTPDPNKFALVIGNEDYNSFKQTTSYEVNVDYAAKDATAFAEYAKDYMGVPESNVILLKNATYAQMNFNINKLMMMSKTNPGNVELYIFYAGHGQHDVDSKETYLIPVDVSISSPTAGIKLEKLYADLGESKAKRSMVFMDACYSGVGRGIVIKPKEAPISGNIVVFTATSSTQRSMPYQEKKHGLFTYYLLKTIRDNNGNISVGSLYDSVKKEVVKNSIWINNSEQTPELLNGQNIDSGWENWTIY